MLFMFAHLKYYFINIVIFCQNRIGGVMVSEHPWSAVHRGFDPWSEQTKDYEVSFVASPLSMHMKASWLGIRILCTSAATCLPAECCFSDLSLYKSN